MKEKIRDNNIEKYDNPSSCNEDRCSCRMNEGSEVEDIETVTQLTIEDVDEKIHRTESGAPSEEELEQENVIINPDPSSMQSRG